MTTFKKFLRQGILYGAPSVRITPKQLVFNTVSYAKYLKDFEYVELFYSDELMAIGVRPENIVTENSFAIKAYRGQKSPIVNVNCTEFLRYFKIFESIGKVKSFLVEQDEKGMLIIHLKESPGTPN